VAIIMDGNGRWAQRRHLPVAAGHRAGVRALRAVIERALDRDILELSVFSFSTENWNRPPAEVEALMDLFIEMIEKEVPDLHKQRVRVRFLGRRQGVPPALVERIERSEALTAANDRMTFYIAFNYGGRAELDDAARAYAVAMASQLRGGNPLATGLAAAEDATPAGRAPAWGAGAQPHPETAPTGAPPPATAQAPVGASAAPPGEALRPFLYAPEMHDPDLLIRTSPEMRLSNFLLWQLAYTELYFTPKLWPDFGGADLDEALAEYGRRQRRYGGR
jgi:undecaprenyl diphosphate synthase